MVARDDRGRRGRFKVTFVEVFSTRDAVDVLMAVVSGRRLLRTRPTGRGFSLFFREAWFSLHGIER